MRSKALKVGARIGSRVSIALRLEYTSEAIGEATVKRLIAAAVHVPDAINLQPRTFSRSYLTAGYSAQPHTSALSPTRPKTNGKAECFIQTSFGESATAVATTAQRDTPRNG